jgi:hypothetical protein
MQSPTIAPGGAIATEIRHRNANSSSLYKRTAKAGRPIPARIRSNAKRILRRLADRSRLMPDSHAYPSLDTPRRAWIDFL